MQLLDNYYEHKLLHFIDIHDNVILTKLKPHDLHRLLNLLNHYKLRLRNNIGLNKNITFGYELEMEYVDKIKMADVWYKEEYSKKYEYKNDGTLNDGVEIASPILMDEKKTWNLLVQICNICNEFGSIGPNSGGHIHIGAHSLNYEKDELLNFLYLWACFENVISRFSYGLFLNHRPALKSYAKPVAYSYSKIYSEYKNSKYASIHDIIKRLSYSKNLAINFKNVKDFNKQAYKNTIEFRTPNESLNPIIKQNEILLFWKLLEYAKNSNFDYDKVKSIYLENYERFSDVNSYNKIYLSQAIILADMIFDNNLDKLYFLRQYIKSFQVSEKSMVKAKQFTKY
ncbi:MAG: amidoligase family protein [Bacilli bacterium]|nr:amidoligase family protein [Bacilli bacterium]